MVYDAEDVKMGVQKKTRKFAQVKRVIGQRDARLQKNKVTGADQQPKKKKDDLIREVYAVPTAQIA